MKVESIQISGFRSFDKFELKEVPPGLVFVIGKNGSGKSNLVAALRAVVTNVLGGTPVMTEDVRQPWDGAAAEVSLLVQLSPDEFDQIGRIGLLSQQPPEFARFARRYGSVVSRVRLTTTFQPGPTNQSTSNNRSVHFFAGSGSAESKAASGMELTLMPM